MINIYKERVIEQAGHADVAKIMLNVTLNL